MTAKIIYKNARFLFRFLMILGFGILFIVVVSNVIIVLFSSKYLTDNTEDIAPHNAALVLGTSSHFRSGAPNIYFHHRMNAAAALYHSGKVQYLILSGDNRTIYYNEPQQMKNELLKMGVPDSVIYLDYAGLRTLDSVIRCSEIFGQDEFIIVSQKFHNQRAIFLARAHGLKVIGFNADNIDSSSHARVQFREFFARVKVFLDLITRKGPQYLGEPIGVGI